LRGMALQGYGQYSLNPSASSGAVAVLLADTEHGPAMSLNRTVDMDVLWPELRPVLQQAEAANWSAASSLTAAAKARKVSCRPAVMWAMVRLHDPDAIVIPTDVFTKLHIQCIPHPQKPTRKSAWHNHALILRPLSSPTKLVRQHLRPGIKPPDFLSQNLDGTILRDASRQLQFSQVWVLASIWFRISNKTPPPALVLLILCCFASRGLLQAIFVRRAVDVGLVDLEHAGAGGESTMLRHQLLESLERLAA